jgi:TonB family protein
MLDLSQKRPAVALQRKTSAQTQPRKLMLALILLLVGLVAVLISERQFWFGGEQATIESDMPASQPAQNVAQTAVRAPQPVPATAKKQVAPKSAAVTNATQAPSAPAVTTTRTVLPPLDVEVVAGDAHRTARPGNARIQVTTPTAQPAATNAAEREAVAESPQASYKATYPALAQHMNVQGSVVLQAVIGTDGVIETLKIMSGPAILASAAQQAVREWRFKPIMQNGQAVESKATITVNFTIRVADSSANTTLAESSAADTLIITR